MPYDRICGRGKRCLPYYRIRGRGKRCLPDYRIQGRFWNQRTESHKCGSGGERGKIKRRELVGVVTSDKMQKTRVVLVERRLSHAKYGKYLTSRTKYKAHDENNEYKTGDRVLFGKYNGTEVKLDGEDRLIIREDDILGVFEP